jgi:maleate cis-trans isomerase
MLGWRRRIGYISPGSLEIPAYDFYQVAPEGVSLVSLTAPISDWRNDEYEKNLEQVEDAAAYLAKRHVHMVIHAGAPPVASQGRDFMYQLIKRMTDRTGLPASTALYSAMEACRWLGGQNLVVVTPFPPETHRNIVTLLEEEGFRIAHEERMEAAFFTLNEISERQIYNFVTAALRRGVQAGAQVGYVPCPQWHVFEMIEFLERDTGLPLVTSDGGDYWYAFHTLGVTDVQPGHGMLMDRLRGLPTTHNEPPFRSKNLGERRAEERE